MRKYNAKPAENWNAIQPIIRGIIMVILLLIDAAWSLPCEGGCMIRDWIKVVIVTRIARTGMPIPLINNRSG